ncbi:MAG: hypothetical protein QM724_12840 [Flavobacteriales bacterium]
MARTLLLALALTAAFGVSAQARIIITHVRAVEKGDTTAGRDVTLQLNKAEGAERAVILGPGGLEAKLWAKVSTHNSRRSSLKDSAVDLIFEIDLKAGKDKDNKRVEKIFYLDQARTATMSQRFNFKDGITMRGITLSFDCEIQ